MTARDVARELTELIAALDRRVPGIGKAGEAAIAHEAAALRARAVERLAQITRTTREPAAKGGGNPT